MSRHRNFQGLERVAGAVLDEFDGYEEEAEEEDELSPEDRQQMTNGTQEVRTTLGANANKVTKAQIEEALWHYYYDIDKTVEYLTRKFIAPPPPKAVKKAPECMYCCCLLAHNPQDRLVPSPNRLPQAKSVRQMAEAILWQGDPPGSNPVAAGYPVPGVPLLSPASYFYDLPWFGVPLEREALLLAPVLPRGGLLGGADRGAKMSKLQALAASRKKKTEGTKQEEKVGEVKTSISRLSISETGRKENARPGSSIAAARHKLPGRSIPAQDTKRPLEISAQATSFNNAGDPATSTASSGSLQESDSVDTEMRDLPDEDCVVSATFQPSAFARTLFGPPPTAPATHISPQTIPMPYTASPTFDVAAFTKPSPDDVVLAAQAQGSRFANTK